MDIPLALSSFLILLLSTLAVPPVEAQAGRVEGLVVDATSNEPLAGVNISLVGTTYGASSGPNGRYTIHGLPAGKYRVRASMIGYEDQQRTVQVIAGEITVVDYRLEFQWIEIPEIVVERVTLTGGLQGLESLPGSAHFISAMELERLDYGDVSRVLRQVPGINIQEEDGYGLRPNIGLRGSGSERSAKITIMEDGVLAAPAPYAAPAAYYFPTVGRMQAVEVRKGSSQIKYGPYTTGGALNMVSTQIPSRLSGRFDFLGGEDDARVIRAHIGNSLGHTGFLLETYQSSSDGFKRLDGGGSTGFDKRDYLAKVRLSTDPDARIYQALTLKAGRTDEVSDETYLGLTDADYALTPRRRYAGSQQDRMDADHTQFVVRHLIRPAGGIDVTTTLYHSNFDRNWYKLDRVRASTGGPAVRIADVLGNPEVHAAELSVLEGSTSPNDDALQVKANNRSYFSRGVQSIVGLTRSTGSVDHEVELGIRIHEDEMDRFQWVDEYRMDGGTMIRTLEGIPGTESNRIEHAQATSAFVQYGVELGRVRAVPGIRYEHVTLRRRDYGRNDVDRTGKDLKLRTNRVDAWIPGIGIDVDLFGGAHAFAGVHRGFAPPDSREGTRPESSTNYEIGGRLLRGLARAEAVLFYTDYQNLLGSDLAASGGDGTANQFNGGEVTVRGVELSAAYDFGVHSRRGYSVPVRLSYTFTSARFDGSFESDFEPWGAVETGDNLPYVPRYQLGGAIGFETLSFGLDLSTEYTGRMRTRAGRGAYVAGETTDAHLTIDLGVSYRIGRQVQVVGRVLNVTDAVYIAARRPAGIRPGLPRRVTIGIKTTL